MEQPTNLWDHGVRDDFAIPRAVQMEKGLVTGFYGDLSPAIAHVDLAGIPLVDIPLGTQL